MSDKELKQEIFEELKNKGYSGRRISENFYPNTNIVIDLTIQKLTETKEKEIKLGKAKIKTLIKDIYRLKEKHENLVGHIYHLEESLLRKEKTHQADTIRASADTLRASADTLRASDEISGMIKKIEEKGWVDSEGIDFEGKECELRILREKDYQKILSEAKSSQGKEEAEKKC